MSIKKGVLRSLLVLTASCSVALFLGVSPASADAGPHISQAINAATVGGAVNGPSNGTGHVSISTIGADRCSSCHRAHTAQSAFLLAASSQEALCFTCHGDGGAGSSLNVQSGVQSGTGKALRGGGFEAAKIGTSTATKDIYWNASRLSWSSTNQYIPPLATSVGTTSSHLEGGTVMWGNGALGSVNAVDGTPSLGQSLTAKLECGSCHDPHGNGQYRILKPVPTDSAFAVKTANTNVLDSAGVPIVNSAPGVFIKDTANKTYTTANYWIAADSAAFADTSTKFVLGATSITDPTPKVRTANPAGTVFVDSYEANVSAWCTTCHTRYLAPSESYKTDSGDATFTYRHTGDNVGGEYSANRNCAQCHVAHGSNASTLNSPVEYPGGKTKSTDSRLLRVDERGICLMCHNL